MKLNLKMSELFIFTKTGPMPDEMYDYYMKGYEMKEVTF